MQNNSVEPGATPGVRKPSLSGAPVLIASGFGDAVSGGGLFAVHDSGVERIDRIGSMGLAVEGGRLARILRCMASDADLGEVAIYDARGVQRYLRLDDTASIHDVVWDGDDLVVVCPWDNAVRWFAPTGTVVREIRFEGPHDSRHINCITRRAGRWYATEFGGEPIFRGWDSVAQKGQGRILELDTGRTVASGLSAPHSPRWVDGMWLVCNSAANEFLAIEDGAGRIIRRVDCGHWTRGLAHDENFFYVGACQRRNTRDSFGDAQIVVIDRRSWQIAERITVPAQEIYDLAFVTPELLEGCRRGFDVNPVRTRELRQYRILTELGIEEPRHLWPTGDPLPWGDFRCSLACDLPAVWTAGEARELAVRLTNISNSFFTSAPPAPIYLSYKWLNVETGAYLDQRRAYRSRLPRTIFPGETVDITGLIVVPDVVGRAILKITLMQEGISWFDDQSPSNAVEREVEIQAGQSITPSATPIDTGRVSGR